MQLKTKCDYITELENTVESYEIALKENRNEIEIYETQLRNKNDIIINYEKHFVNIKELRSLQQESDEKSALVEEIQSRLHEAERELQTQNNMKELHELVGTETKDQRLADLEEALKESMNLVAEREMVLQQEKTKRKQIVEKVIAASLIFVLLICFLQISKLEQRLLSLQSAQAMRCHSCRPFAARMSSLESKLMRLINERRDHLCELANMK